MLDLDCKVNARHKEWNPQMYKRLKSLRRIETDIVNEITELSKQGENVTALLDAINFLNRGRRQLMTKYFPEVNRT